MPPRLFAAVVTGLCQRHAGERQQPFLRARGMQFVGVLVWSRDQLTVAVEDERGAGASDLELREEMRQPCVFDHDRQHALAFLIHIDGTRERDRRTLADWMVDHPGPLRSPGLHPVRKPCLVHDAKIRWHKLAGLEFDVARNDRVFVDPALAWMIGQRNFHHFQMAVAELVGGEERTIRPAEGDPGYVGLRLQLRQKDELALVCLAGVEHVLQEEGAYGGLGRNRFADDRRHLLADGGHDLLVDGAGELPAGGFRRAPPQQARCRGGQEDRRQHQRRHRKTDADRQGATGRKRPWAIRWLSAWNGDHSCSAFQLGHADGRLD